MRICKKCKFPKELSDFPKLPKGRDGVRPVCRECFNAPRRKHPVEVHPGVAAEVPVYAAPEAVPSFYSDGEALPPLLQPLAGNTELQKLLLAQKNAKPLKAPKGVIAPAVIEPVVPDRVWRIALITDIHVPDVDPHFWYALLCFLYEEQPDEIIIMGDFVELESCSQHKGANVIQLCQDFEYGKNALDELRATCPNAVMTYLEGNHETRLNRFLAAEAPSLVGSLSVPAGLELEARGITWVPEDAQPISRGDLDILHGHQMEGGRKGLPKYHAFRAVSIYGQPRHKVTYGHTHKPQRYSEPAIGGTKQGIGLGCGRTLKPKWVAGSEAGWVLEFGYAYVKPDGTTSYYQIEVSNGTFVWNGKVYGQAKE